MFVSVLYSYIMNIICMCESVSPCLAFLYPCMGVYGYIWACIMEWVGCMYVCTCVCMSVCSFGCSLGSFFVATSFKL